MNVIMIQDILLLLSSRIPLAKVLKIKYSVSYLIYKCQGVLVSIDDSSEIKSKATLIRRIEFEEDNLYASAII
ncbi:MAG: hypothetical protein ACI94Y_000735 [Maribacter sp.]|jgi:hypothetical protein